VASGARRASKGIATIIYRSAVSAPSSERSRCPGGIDRDKIEARLKNGELVLTLLKTPEAMQRGIQKIRGGYRD
jgi:hypothetical protein